MKVCVGDYVEREGVVYVVENVNREYIVVLTIVGHTYDHRRIFYMATPGELRKLTEAEAAAIVLSGRTDDSKN